MVRDHNSNGTGREYRQARVARALTWLDTHIDEIEFSWPKAEPGKEDALVSPSITENRTAPVAPRGIENSCTVGGWQGTLYTKQRTSAPSRERKMKESFAAQVEAAFDECNAAGIWEMNSQPPIYLLFWQMGIEVPPPHYRSFIGNFLTCAILFGTVLGLLMSLLFLIPILTQSIGNHSGREFLMVFGSASLVAGFAFGLGMAIYYKVCSFTNGLSSWFELRENRTLLDSESNDNRA